MVSGPYGQRFASASLGRLRHNRTIPPAYLSPLLFSLREKSGQTHSVLGCRKVCGDCCNSVRWPRSWMRDLYYDPPFRKVAVAQS
jgi:hypothetical protein